jgi:CBS domain-containing protein/gamma-glutamyl:cysteine ligase YbdK (ATP-grasp superfamily)
MGQHDVQELDSQNLRSFTQKLLADLRALETMLASGAIESGVRRIGAEQELFLIDRRFRPAPLAMEALERIGDEHFTTEVARFNLEYNADPLDFAGDCLSRLERQLVDLLEKARAAVATLGADLVMIGILPTLDISDLTLANMTPKPRYFALNEAMRRLRGKDWDFYIKGTDELIIRHDSVMVEACNTSFQAHYQVGPEEFAGLYNLTQAVAGPVLAAACNAPILFGRRLWRETRIALFQQSVDHRAAGLHLREQAPRVSFGRRWVDDSVLEIFSEDIARFRVLLSAEIDEDPFECLRAGRPPQLKALRLHNGTIYRWTRPCYGILDGKPHLRIENRILPAGPTILDEVANAAFWFGLLSGLSRVYPDVRRVMEFDTAAENFVAAARLGLRAQFAWPGHQHAPAQELIQKELLPLAREGLAAKGIDAADIDRYLAVIEERVTTRRTGAQWQLDSLAGLRDQGGRAERLAALVAATVANQRTGRPVAQWPLADLAQAGSWEKHYARVGQFMTTDLFTVGPDEAIELVAHLMQWKRIRHVPVEDNEHRLLGLISQRSMIRLIAERFPQVGAQAIAAREVMTSDPVTVSPETSVQDAMALMRRHRVGSLPVVKDDRLVGIITEYDFLGIAAQLMDKELGPGPPPAPAAGSDDER